MVIRKKIGIILLIIAAFGVAAGISGYLLLHNHAQNSKQQPAATNPSQETHLAFLMEVYDTIKTNYWEVLTDQDLAKLYTLGIEKINNQQLEKTPTTKEELVAILAPTLAGMNEQKKNEFCSQLANIVLVNLQPLSRSQLYSQAQVTNLGDRVNNRDTSVDLYKILGLDKQASLAQVIKLYDAKMKELANDKSAQAEEKKQLLQRAFQTFSDPANKKAYDQNGTEPTVIGNLINPAILSLRIVKFSPATSDELTNVAKKYDQGDDLDTLIIDLRDNVGGDIDDLPVFLGPFLGNDQYAYQFLHQGQRIDFKTTVGWLPSLVRYKKVVVLINENTQSTAEEFAAALKRYNIGVLLGSATKGWGTVERVFPINNQFDKTQTFSVFLAHSLTLADDNQPIEGRGVQPTISLNDPNWEKELYSHFRYPELADAIKEMLKQ
jgi:curved DNA-binding protein CbpA/flagellar basal body-associated protein FliL